MNELVQWVFWAFISLGVLLMCIGLSVAYQLLTSSKSYDPDAFIETSLPKATIILALRGADPFLANCLKSLFNQNYPNYQISIVIDSYEDEAWGMVEQTLHRQSSAIKVDVHPLQVKRLTCGLKCSALIQAIAALDDDCEIVAFVDADTITHHNWLRDLVNPLQNPEIGATTGNRWYSPNQQQWGSLTRYLGNIPTLVHMYSYAIPWGGSLAMRKQDLNRTGLLEQWSQSLVEDVPVYRAMTRQGLRVQFVPSAITMNHEECSLPSYFRWIQRQLLCVRLYHPSWPVIIIHGSITTFLPLLGIGLLLTAVWTRQWESALWVASGLAFYLMSQVFIVIALDQGVQKIIQARQEEPAKFSLIAMLKLWIAIPLTQLVLMTAIARATISGYTHWRGIQYRIKGPWDIQLIRYVPYQRHPQIDVSHISL